MTKFLVTESQMAESELDDKMTESLVPTCKKKKLIMNNSGFSHLHLVCWDIVTRDSFSIYGCNIANVLLNQW
jgi:hypothetical protein